MPVKGKKSLVVSEATHKKIGHESVATGRDMYELVDEAWALYEARRDGKLSSPVLMPPPKKNLHTTSIAVPNEIAQYVEFMVKVIARPGGMEAFRAMIKHVVESAPIAKELAAPLK